MANNKLILRTLNSPWTYPTTDLTKNSVLTHQDVDNNFIYLKGEVIYSAGTTGDFLNLNKVNGTNLSVDLGFLSNDIYVTSGVYSPITGVVTFTNNSGGTFNVSGFTTGMTDSYTTAASLSGNTIIFDNNIQGSNLFNVDLTSILGGAFVHVASGKINPTNAYGNSNSDNFSSILGGQNNTIGVTSYFNNTIAGGYNNTITGGSLGQNTILGGFNNTASGYAFNALLGGYGNQVSSPGSVVVGGDYNSVNASTYTFTSSIIGGGSHNLISDAEHSFIGSGYNNKLYSNKSSIIGGQNNTVNHSNTHIIGSNITSVTANTTHVEKLNIGTLNGTAINVGLGLDANGMVVSGDTSATFTGNTSGDCITDIFVSNIHSCSPLNINPLNEGNVYFGNSSGFSVDISTGNTKVGINVPEPSYALHMAGDMYLPSGSVGIGESPDPTQKARITTTDADGTNTTALRVDLSQINAGAGGINVFNGIQVRSTPTKTFTGITQQWGVQSNLTSTVSATGNHMVVGGRFRAKSTNADNFGIQIEDGTEVAGRVLVCQPTSLYGQVGLAHWEDVTSLSGVGSTNKYAASIAFTGGTKQTITHNLNTEDVQVQLKDSTGTRIIEDVADTYTSNTVDIEVSITGTYRVIIIG
jgi:hypothetical protein